jgi:hypothetical protein
LLVSNRHRVNHVHNVYHHSGAEVRSLLVNKASCDASIKDDEFIAI